MDTTDVPASYRIRRTVPPYKPAKTPYVGKQLDRLNSTLRDFHERPYVVIREAGDGYVGGGKSVPFYWVAPILPDGTLGKMTTAPLSKADLQS